MNYIYIKEPVEQAALAAVGIIREHLFNGEHVLLLLSGGSNLEIASIISKSKRLKNIDLSRLFVSLTDERYGPIGHADENWQKLINVGLDLPGANLYRPLIGQDIEKTTRAFNDWLSVQLLTADYKLGVFGIGADGHTAGIKPGSNAIESLNLATSFVGSDFSRITISITAIKQLDEAIVQASGDDKQPIIHELIYDAFPIVEKPAQIFKQIKLATLYTNVHKEVY